MTGHPNLDICEAANRYHSYGFTIRRGPVGTCPTDPLNDAHIWLRFSKKALPPVA